MEAWVSRLYFYSRPLLLVSSISIGTHTSVQESHGALSCFTSPALATRQVNNYSMFPWAQKKSLFLLPYKSENFLKMDQTIKPLYVCVFIHVYAYIYIYIYRASVVAQMVKNLPAMQETWVQSLGQEDPLEKGTATRFSILTWRIPRTEEPGRLQSMESQRVEHCWAICTHSLTHI